MPDGTLQRWAEQRLLAQRAITHLRVEVVVTAAAVVCAIVLAIQVLRSAGFGPLVTAATASTFFALLTVDVALVAGHRHEPEAEEAVSEPEGTLDAADTESLVDLAHASASG